MPARQMTDTPLSPELEAIATAAADRRRAEADPHTNNHDELQRRSAQGQPKVSPRSRVAACR
jgi:hypothetical protein